MLLFNSSCSELIDLNNSSASTSRHEQMSKEICACTADFLQIADRMSGYVKDDNKEALKKIMPKMEALLPQYEACMKELENKYPDIGKTKADEERALKALEKECPRLYQYMNN